MPFKIPVVSITEVDESIDLQGELVPGSLLILADKRELEQEKTEMLLENIFKYIGLDDAEVSKVCPSAGKSVYLLDVMNKYAAEKILIFGLSLDRLHVNLQVKPYQPRAWNGRQLFFVHSLRQLDENVVYKKELFKLINSHIK